MKYALLLLIAAPVFAQPSEGTDLIDMGTDLIPTYTHNGLGEPALYSTIQDSWSITRAADGTKQFTFTAKDCQYVVFDNAPEGSFTWFWTTLAVPRCTTLSQSEAEALAPVAAALKEFYDYHPKAPHDPPDYNPQPPTTPPNPFPEALLRPRLTTAPALAPANPQMIFLDGLGSNLIQYDLTAQKITSTVAVPSTTGPLGIRPVATGATHEVWTANGGVQVTVSDLTTQSVVTNIKMPSLPQSAQPAGIVFTPDGTTAFEAFGLLSPDSSGNSGALAVFDAVNRKVTSTFPLKDAPVAVLIARDGYTVYLLSGDGVLTYYDVLSGTADLSVSTYTPGLAGGYPGNSAQIFLTPDGTHLYWNINYLIVGFDLTTHKISSTVNTGLASTSPSTMYMAPDGLRIWLTNTNGTVAVYDVPTDGVIGTFTTDPLSATYIGPGN